MVATLTLGGIAEGTVSGVENLLLAAGGGDDSIVGGVGSATIYGGGGNDTLRGGLEGGFLGGGAGDDLLDGRGLSYADYASATFAVHIDLAVTGPQNTLGAGTDTLIDILGAGGSVHADTLLGSVRGDYLSGNSGSDLVYGGDGDDTLAAYLDAGESAFIDGGMGDDVISVGGSGADSGAATVFGGDGADTLSLADSVSTTFYGGAGDDRVAGVLSSGFQQLTLGAGSDTVSLDQERNFFQGNIAQITDFQVGDGGDVLDLSPLGVTATAVADGQLQLLQNGPETLVVIDPDGGGNNYVITYLLSGVQGSALTAFNLSGITLPPAPPPPDVAPPALAGIDLPNHAFVSQVEGRTTFTIGAEDSGSGISFVTLVFDKDWLGPAGLTHAVTLSDADGAFAGPIATGSIAFEPGSPAGVYTLVDAVVRDVAGNVTDYTTTQLAALGFDTAFQLIDTRPLPPPDVSAVAPSQVEEGESFSLALSFTGQDTAGGTVSWSLSDANQTSAGDIDPLHLDRSFLVTPGPDGGYTLNLGTYTALADGVHEGTEDLVVSVRVSGHLFANGRDTTTVTIPILNIDARIAGTATADRLLGTAGDDRVSAGDGNDTLIAGAGTDILDGGSGNDVLSLAGFSQDYRLEFSGGAGSVSGGPEGGNDTLSSIEETHFLDGQLTFDLQSTAAQILRLYDSFLGRAPDVGGFDSYLKFFAAGHTFQEMAANAAASSEFHDATAALTDTQYITYVYEHSLRREPDPGGLQNYLDAVHNGSLTRTSMIVQAAESPEHVALTAGAVGAGLWVPDEKVEGLELLYDAAVQRQPDPTGIAGYTALLASGTTFRQIANQMAASPEFQAAHGSQTDAEYVDSLYVAEVGRHADGPGLAAYVYELAHGHTRGDVLYETAMSAEHQSHVLAYYDPLLIGA